MPQQFVSGWALVGELSSKVTLHHLLTGFQTGSLSLAADGAMAALLALYCVGLLRLRARGRAWSLWRSVSFAAGVVAVFLAVGSGVAYYEDSSFVMHVIQGLALMNVAPVLLALGAPVTLLLRASGRRSRNLALSLLHCRPVETLTRPVFAAALAYVTMIVYFLTPVYALSIRHPLLHDYAHLQFLVVGCLYWWPVVGVDPSHWRLSYPARLGYLVTGVPVNGILGVALTLSRSSIDPAVSTVVDTHRGGAVFWGVGELLLLAGIAVMYVQWARSDRMEAARLDRRIDRELAADRERGLAGGYIMDPTTGLWHYPDERSGRHGRAG